MYYPDELVEDVRARNDIVDVIGSYVRLKKQGSNYLGLCPFHSEKTPSFSVSPHKQMFYCFGCHEGGNVITFIQKFENYSFIEAVKILADRVQIALPDNSSNEQKQRDSKRAKLLEINKEAGKYYYYSLRSEAGQGAYEYLTQRGLDEGTIKKFGLGYAGGGYNATYKYLKSKGYSDELLNESGLFVFREQYGIVDKFRYRAMFPIMDANHRIVAFGGRVMGDGEPKYLNSPETDIFDKSHILFGLNIAKSSKAKNIIVCEGYMDAISLHQAGFDQAVASLGTAFTSGHASLLKRYAKEYRSSADGATVYRDILMCYDSDNAGIDGNVRAIRILMDTGFTVKVIDMSPYKDPDEFIKNLGAQEFQNRIDSAQNAFMFTIKKRVEPDFDLSDPSGKAKFINEIARRIVSFKDAVERDGYIELVAKEYKVSTESLLEQVKKQAALGAGITISQAPKETIKAKNEQEDPMRKAQGMLLTWITEEPSIYRIIRKYLTKDDFTDEICQQVAEVIFEQADNGEIAPAKIITMFTEEDEQKVVSQLLNEYADYIDTVTEKEMAIRDLIIKIKKHSLETHKTDEDINAVRERKALLAELKKIKINFNE